MIRALLRGRQCTGTAMRFFSVGAADGELTPPEKSVSKEAMLKLRKKTGYSFVNCRKALLKFGENNLVEAENYLKEMAVKEGWAKAAKVGNRQTSQGQCGIVAEGNLAAVVELKCETDFVAKSAPFKQLVSDIAIAVLEYAKNRGRIVRTVADNSGLKSVELDTKELKKSDGTPIDEIIASVIGQLGENITFANAHLLYSHSDALIYGFSHPKDGNDRVEIGRFVSAVGVKRIRDSTNFPTEKLAYQICQHIIGMNPTSLRESSPKTDSTNSVKETSNVSEDQSESTPVSPDDELNAFAIVESTKMDLNETALLHQSFMLNPSETVLEYLDSHGCDVLDFWRFELGKIGNNESNENS